MSVKTKIWKFKFETQLQILCLIHLNYILPESTPGQVHSSGPTMPWVFSPSHVPAKNDCSYPAANRKQLLTDARILISSRFFINKQAGPELGHAQVHFNPC